LRSLSTSVTVLLAGAFLLGGLLGGVATSYRLRSAVAAPVTQYALWRMGITAGEPWWKQLGKPEGAEACRARVLKLSGRGVVGLLSWYPDPAAGFNVHAGCLPAGYDPYERK
jgi:hypothetical protein